MAPALHDVPTAPGTMRWHIFPPLTAWFFRNTAWKPASRFERPREDAGCRNDANRPAMQSNAIDKRDKLVRRNAVLRVEW